MVLIRGDGNDEYGLPLLIIVRTLESISFVDNDNGE